jgi:two-component system chemotaxis sensor kinase CheA
VELVSARPEAELRDVFEFVEHLAKIRIQSANPSGQSGDAPASEVGDLQQSLTAASIPDRAPATVKSNTFDKKPDSSCESGSVRVAIDKVDRLIDLVGELSIAHVITAQMLNDFEPACLPKLRRALATMERNTRELHERVMGIRMLPVESLFQRCMRTSYEISRATGKHIRLETIGGETEIDKNMLELLADPLTHLVRNAADHGIEFPEDRLVAAKPEEGVITLRAFHRSGRVVIEISDDGAGIDTERVRSKAVERKLIEPKAKMSDDQLRMLIFEPGFSTRDEVSDLSGRGVGMDVVKRNVQRLNGTVSLASEKTRGTLVTIELPLTLAVLEGLLVRVGERTLVLPLLSVIEAVSLGEGKIVRLAERGEMIVIRGESIPLMRLSRFLGLTSETKASPDDEFGNRKLAVIVETENRKTGLVVDELLGQQQVVVKSLERNLHRIDGLMGATILGDGRVAPIVDATRIGALNLFSLQAPGESSKKHVAHCGSTASLVEGDRGGTAHELV